MSHFDGEDPTAPGGTAGTEIALTLVVRDDDICSRHHRRIPHGEHVTTTTDGENYGRSGRGRNSRRRGHPGATQGEVDAPPCACTSPNPLRQHGFASSVVGGVFGGS